MLKKITKGEVLLADCPLCHGTGKVVKRNNFYSKQTRNMARDLYAQGMTLREIGKKIGVEHPQKVKSLIMAKSK